MINFADLHLAYGYPIQLQVADENGAKHRYFCRLIGCVKDGQILTSHLVTGGQPLAAMRGSTVTARLMTGRGICIFSASIEHIQYQPIPIMYLSYPKAMEFKEIRNAERVEINLPVRIANALRHDQVSEGWIRDISFSGARLELQHPVAVIGDEIVINSDLAIDSLCENFRTNAVVRSRINPPQGNQHKQQHVTLGVEFLETNPSKKILLYAYVSYQLAQSCLPTLS